MNGRLLPEKHEFEEFVLGEIIRELEAAGHHVADVVEGDTEELPFDWLLHMTDGTCIGLEVVRAEDAEAIAHIEREHRAGESVIVGSAEMPWESLNNVIAKKLRKAGRYRKALTNRCTDGQVHLAVTSALQQLRFDGDIGKHMEELARSALGPFDAVSRTDGALHINFRSTAQRVSSLRLES